MLGGHLPGSTGVRYGGIRAKLERADEQLNVLDHLIGSYFAADPYRVSGEEWTEGDYWHYPRLPPRR